MQRQKESVWDYPRPPRVEPVERPVRIELGGEPVAASDRALRVLETASPPVVYLPADAIRPGALRPAAGNTGCEWKGIASYFDVIAAGRTAERAAFAYPSPNPRYAQLRDRVGFYPGRVECFLGDERVRPQPGSFYAGWITDEIEGPFKGAPGTEGW